MKRATSVVSLLALLAVAACHREHAPAIAHKPVGDDNQALRWRSTLTSTRLESSCSYRPVEADVFGGPPKSRRTCSKKSPAPKLRGYAVWVPKRQATEGHVGPATATASDSGALRTSGTTRGSS